MREGVVLDYFNPVSSGELIEVFEIFVVNLDVLGEFVANIVDEPLKESLLIRLEGFVAVEGVDGPVQNQAVGVEMFPPPE